MNPIAPVLRVFEFAYRTATSAAGRLLEPDHLASELRAEQVRHHPSTVD